MRVKIQGFLNNNHSWAIVNQNIGRALIKKGHQVDFIPTDQGEAFPDDLKPHLRENINEFYSVAISYTAPINWQHYLSGATKNKFGLWTWEYRGSLDKNGNRYPTFPPGFAKCHQYVDKILAPSNFARDTFLDNKVSADKVIVVPHGIDFEQFSTTAKYPLQTKRKYKILANIAQPHLRKNIPSLFESFGRAFTNKDDVCLVCKVYLKNKKDDGSQLDVDFWKIFNDFKKKYPNHAPIEVINKFIPNIAELYNACDILYTTSFCEAYYMPGCEVFGADRIFNICPNYGGQLDFLNDQNSLLITGKEIQADRRMQYWTPNVQAVVFQVNLDDACQKLQYAIKNYDDLSKKFIPEMEKVKIKYSWDVVVDQILGLCE